MSTLYGVTTHRERRWTSISNLDGTLNYKRIAPDPAPFLGLLVLANW